MMHPLFVHFTVALPVLILLIELVNLFTKKRTLGVLSFFLMLLVAGVFLAAYLAGITDGKAAKAFLSPEAKEMLTSHKELGIYLVYSAGILLLFKLFSVLIRKTAIRVLFFLVLILFAIAVLNEGKKGGALVYQYGVNVKSVPAIVNAPKKEKHEGNITKPDTVLPETAIEKKSEPVAEKIPKVTANTEASPEAASQPEGNASH